PMVYPSHYWTGSFGYKVPDREPYGVVRQSSKDHLVRMEAVDSKIILRPWLQDFTASWVKGYIRYGVEEIHAQLRALEDLGIKEYLVWNAGNKYTEEAFRTWKSN
ncbi:MAG TPA: GTP-binding protein, partial [Firmicutes bacterium]|nr:GTP-binding protein [Bacillota bacterium]